MRLPVLVLLVLVLGGCSSSEDAAGALGAPCASNGDCDSALSCGYGRCRSKCDTNAACSTHACLSDATRPGVCALSGDRGCTAGGCGSGLVCGADDVCRPACSDASECALGAKCLSGACFNGLPGSEDGWLLHGSTRTGRLELYATRDDGSRSVRLTDGLTQNTDQDGMVRSPIASPDGKHIAFQWGRDPNTGAMDFIARVYRMDPDGANLTFLVMSEQAGEKYALTGVSWLPDSRHIVYGQHVPCVDSLAKLDAINPGTPETIFDPAASSTENPLPAVGSPAINPVDPDDLLFSNAPCGSGSYTRRANLKTQQVVEVPATAISKLPQDPWAPDGTEFVIAFENRVSVISAGDLSKSETLYAEQEEGVTLNFATYGNDGRRIYFVRVAGGAVLDVAVYERATGKSWPLGITDLNASQPPDWTRLPIDPDRDGDGLGNGIDPTPDG